MIGLFPAAHPTFPVQAVLAEHVFAPFPAGYRLAPPTNRAPAHRPPSLAFV